MTKRRPAQKFEVILEPVDKGGYHVYVPALKGRHSFGATKEEAMKNIAEAVSLWLECADDLGYCKLGPFSDRFT